MTLEEVLIQKPAERAQCSGKALEEVLVSAKDNDALTVGVYECAKVMNLDPDSVSFCVLATDEQFECDIALQIHFTLIQSFCFDNDISIVRVSDVQRLAQIVGDDKQLEDAHCVLITVRGARSTGRVPSSRSLSMCVFSNVHVRLTRLPSCVNRTRPTARGRTPLWRSCTCSVRRAAV
uniref:Growth arrest and DNA-damage-inducible, gamma b, tandem duplicate 1 n=1 Tax=Scophthalmus maximus TaxID=52904 RepID=A0A8D3BVZ8_SCOMX